MNLDLTEDQTQIRDAVRELCRGEFAPHAARWDRESKVPPEAVKRLAEQGFLGMGVPEEWGGLGYDARTIITVIEEIAYVSAALAIMIAVHNSVGATPVFRFGTDAQRKRFLPRLVSKELGAFSLSEPGAGSDAGALESTAVRDGDDYVLNGSKNWVTNGQQAGVILVFAKTDRDAGNRGISAFIVERGTPGLVLGKSEDKMGLRGSDTVALALEDLRVPADQRLGAEGDGFRIAMSMLDAGRIGVAAQALGRDEGGVRRGGALRAAAQGVRRPDREDPGGAVQAGRDGAPRAVLAPAGAAGGVAARRRASPTRARRPWRSSTRARPRPT